MTYIVLAKRINHLIDLRTQNTRSSEGSKLAVFTLRLTFANRIQNITNTSKFPPT